MALTTMPTKSSTLSHDSETLPSKTIVHKWTVANPRAIIILQHGFCEYAERYVDQHYELIRHFNHARFEVRALDMWGHGRSIGIRGVTNVRRAVSDHLEVRKRASIEGLPIFLFGHSMGGLVTAGSVTADPSNVRGVLLTGPALPEPLPKLGQHVVEIVAFVIPTISIPRKPSPLSRIGRMANTEQVAAADPLMVKRQVPFLLAATALQTMEKITQNYERWQVPTLVMHGTADCYTAVEGSERFVNSIASKDKKLLLYDDGYHELLNDLERDVVLQDILKWLEDHLGEDQSS